LYDVPDLLAEGAAAVVTHHHGGGFFEAADTDLDGAVEIWTDDSAAVNEFEGLALSEIDAVPTYVLRLDHNRLLDASSEFHDFFDDVIKRVRASVNPTACEISKPAMEDCKRALIHLHRNSSA